MIVLPIENRLDWRYPPLVTLFLIVVNTWVFFACLNPDEEAASHALQLYRANDLIEVEASVYRVYWDANPGLHAEGERLPDSAEEVLGYLFWDLGFDAFLHQHPPESAPPDWRLRRDRFETARDEVSWIGFGLVPAKPRALTFLTSMYLHGGVWHLVGNMVFLFIFGFSLERSVGRVSYFAIYHVTGLLAGLLSVAADGSSYVPGIGASGAVSGLMGAYIGVYRLRKIRFFYNFLIYFGEFRAPALWLFPFWLAKELYGNYFGDQGVGYWAHIGGLLAGAGLGLGLSFLKSGVDREYLDSGVRDAARQADRTRLDQLVDEFKYEQAGRLAARMIEADPADLGTWSIYLSALRTAPDEPAYHRAVLQVFEMAPPGAGNAELGSFIEETYRFYVAGAHPKPALRSASLLLRLALGFTRAGHLDAAQQIANLMIKQRRFDEEVQRLLTALVNRLQKLGDDAAAKRYEQVLRSQFGRG